MKTAVNKPATWTIRERTPGTFTVALSCGNKADGSRNRRYLTIKAANKAAAELELRRMLEDGAAPAPGTIAAMLTKWQRTESYRWRESTSVKFDGVVRKHIIPFVGDVLTDAFDKSAAMEFYAILRENGRTESTVKTVHKVLGMALMAILGHNPIARVKMVKTMTKKAKPPTMAQVKDMLALARESGLWWYPALRLAAYTGMRRGEIMGLRWENVNLAGGYLEVVEGLTYTKGRLRVQPPKTGESRRVTLDAGTVDILSEYKQTQEAHILAMGAEYDHQGIVFSKPNGRYFYPGTLSETVNVLARRTGPKRHLHEFRHFHASVCGGGASLVDLSERLGHANVSMTLNVYGHMMPDAQRVGLDIFVAAMNGNGNQPAVSGAQSYTPDTAGVKNGVNSVSPCLS